MRSVQEIEAKARAIWLELPKDIRQTLKRRGVVISVSEVDPPPSNAAGLFWKPNIILYYGWLKDCSDEFLERAILHEIGHALGMDHPRLKTHNL
jgi:predicted Zn-dependent protease with MMP-like domain